MATVHNVGHTPYSYAHLQISLPMFEDCLMVVEIKLHILISLNEIRTC